MPNENQQAIILADHANLRAEFSQEASRLREVALSAAALIGKVSSPEDQKLAVIAQEGLVKIRILITKAHAAAKRPVIDFGRELDGKLNEFLKEIKDEELRLNRLIGDFQAMELRRQQAAQQAENERLLKIERDKAAEMAAAKTIEEVDAIDAHYDQRVKQEVLPVKPPARAPGQVVKPDWEVTVTNIWELARAHPACVKIEPRLSEIKGLIASGVEKIPGVTFVSTIKSHVRPGRTPPAINV